MAESLPRLNREMLRGELLSEFDQVLEDVASAIDEALPGQLIRDSEEKARDALDRFRRVVYERAMQAKSDAAEAAFPPSPQRFDGKEETP